MKKTTLLAMGLCAAIGLTNLSTTTAQADEKGHKDAKTAVPGTAEGILKAIHMKHGELAKTVADKKLKDVHHLAFAIRDLANALPAKAAADKKKQVEGTVKNIAKLAADLDDSGDANDQAKTEANLKKLDGLLKVLESQFPHDHK
jgi:hypothetical protein